MTINQNTQTTAQQTGGGYLNTPRGYFTRYAAIDDYPSILALVCVNRRIVIVNTKARPGANTIQLHFGLQK